MDGLEKESVLLKSFACFSCYILIIAVIVWSGGGVSGRGIIFDLTKDENAITKFFENDFFNGNLLSKNLYITIIEKDGISIVQFTSSDESPLILNMPLEKINELTKLDGLSVENGVLTIDLADDERKVPLRDIPDGVKTININPDDKTVTYNFGEDDDAGKVVISQKDVYLKKDGDKTTVQGYKIDNREADIDVNLGEKGEIRIEDKGISYKGQGTVLSVDDYVFENRGEKEGFVKFNDEGFDVENSIVIDKDKNIKFETTDGKIFHYGYEKENGGRNLYFDDEGNLKGDVTGLTDFKLDNDREGPIGLNDVVAKGKTIDGESVESETDYNIPSNAGIVINNGKINVKKGSGVTTTTPTPTSENGNGPELPSPTTIVGTPGTNGDNGNGKPPRQPPVPPVPPIPPNGGPPGTGFPSWLLWALLIGGGVLAAMLLFGGGSSSKSEEKKDEIDDSGEPYMGTPEEVVYDYSNIKRENVTVVYNPTQPITKGCDCNESGCFNCPDGNCFLCGTDVEAPVIQGLIDEEDIIEDEDEEKIA